jgi:hypothetical protein
LNIDIGINNKRQGCKIHIVYGGCYMDGEEGLEEIKVREYG